MVYADIRGGSLERRRHLTVGSFVNALLLLHAHWHSLSLFAMCVY